MKEPYKSSDSREKNLRHVVKDTYKYLMQLIKISTNVVGLNITNVMIQKITLSLKKK